MRFEVELSSDEVENAVREAVIKLFPLTPNHVVIVSGIYSGARARIENKVVETVVAAPDTSKEPEGEPL